MSSEKVIREITINFGQDPPPLSSISNRYRVKKYLPPLYGHTGFVTLLEVTNIFFPRVGTINNTYANDDTTRRYLTDLERLKIIEKKQQQPIVIPDVNDPMTGSTTQIFQPHQQQPFTQQSVFIAPTPTIRTQSNIYQQQFTQPTFPQQQQQLFTQQPFTQPPQTMIQKLPSGAEVTLKYDPYSGEWAPIDFSILGGDKLEDYYKRKENEYVKKQAQTKGPFITPFTSPVTPTYQQQPFTQPAQTPYQGQQAPPGYIWVNGKLVPGGASGTDQLMIQPTTPKFNIFKPETFKYATGITPIQPNKKYKTPLQTISENETVHTIFPQGFNIFKPETFKYAQPYKSIKPTYPQLFETIGKKDFPLCDRSNNTKIYFYVGHGSDLCERNNVTGRFELVKETVPANCIYITIEQCGNPTKYLDLMRQVETIARNNPPNREILLYPEIHKQQLAQLLGISENLIHIHFCGMKYVDNTFYPMQLHLNNGSPFIHHSGLMEKSKMEETFDQWPKQRLDSYNNIFNSNLISQYFKASIWPKEEDIQNSINILLSQNRPITYWELNSIINLNSKKLSEIMNRLPGIHYNLVCRAVDPPCSQEQILIQQTQSIANQKAYGLKGGKTKFKHSRKHSKKLRSKRQTYSSKRK